MRILQVVHWFLPGHSAGSEVYTYQLARELARRHEVAIYCREEGHPEREWAAEDGAYEGLPVHRVYYNAPPGPAQLVRRALARFRNGQVARDFAAYLDRAAVKPDIVHFQHLFKLSGELIALCRRRGIPTVVTLHDYWYLCDNGQLLRPGLRPCLGPLGGWRCPGCAELPLPSWQHWALAPALWPLYLYRTNYLRRCLRQADAIISPSAHLAQVFARHGFQGRILVSDNGSDVSGQAERGHAAHAPLRFGYIGTIAPHKGLHVLLEAFARLCGTAELWVYGGAGADEEYAQALRARDVSGVRFLGPFAHGEIARVLAEIDVLVVPSVWAENSPVTIHEARTARVPVLAAEIGGMPDLVREGRAGWLFRPGDIDDLRRQMQRILDDPALVAQVSEGILPVKSIAAQAAELEALYASLIHGQGR